MSGNKSLPGADPIRAAFLFGPSRLAFLLCSGQPTASTANGVIFFSIFLSWREGEEMMRREGRWYFVFEGGGRGFPPRERVERDRVEQS